MVRPQELISRKEAKAQGLRFYFTGKPCSRGHIVQRRTGNFNCLGCEAEDRPNKAGYLADWQRGNKAKVHARNQAWRDRNREKHRAANRKWIRDNPDKANAALARRRAKLRQATPPWANEGAIKAFYRHAARLTRTTGQPYEVDHIIPLAGKKVSGLHVETNLRVVPQAVNRSKGNRWSE